MDNQISQPSSDPATPANRDRLNTEPPVAAERHPVLARLMEEVRNERIATTSYDRVHNRHNRGP